jgi:hypothetical protein
MREAQAGMMNAFPASFAPCHVLLQPGRDFLGTLACAETLRAISKIERGFRQCARPRAKATRVASGYSIAVNNLIWLLFIAWVYINIQSAAEIASKGCQ